MAEVSTPYLQVALVKHLQSIQQLMGPAGQSTWMEKIYDRLLECPRGTLTDPIKVFTEDPVP